MREILFRGKAKKGELYEGKWIEGGFLWWNGKPCIFYNAIHIEVIPETVGQYIGIPDKNGKKIFEGDIIRYTFTSEYDMYLESLECPKDYEGVNFSDLWNVATVVYGIEFGYPAFDLSDHEYECNGLSELKESGLYFYEVIGNIHDNPELLESEVDTE